MQAPARRAARALSAALATLVLGAVGCGSLEFEPIPTGSVDPARQAKAGEFGQKMLQAWARDEYPALGAEATADMQKSNDGDAQKKADKQLEEGIGSFKTMSFAEADRSKPPKVEVYRFKAVFDKSDKPVEVRVVLDLDGKVSGIWVKPWKDAL